MTCEQFQRFNDTGAAFLAMTRGERSACLAHFIDCASCRAWLQEIPCTDPPGFGEEDLQDMIVDDAGDPEFFPEIP